MITIYQSELYTMKTLTKFKLLPLGLAVWYTERHGEYVETVSREMPYPYEESLATALTHLRPHLMILTEMVDGLTPDEAQALMGADRYRVTGVTWGKDSCGVTLVGRKELRGNKVLNLVAPFTKFDDEFEEYMYSEGLYIAICDLEAEILEYIDGTKRGESPQLAIDFSTNPSTDDEVPH
ncbi:hypothetical protein [Salmonirosea aquatica]|uniref:Uncharacterized protein n=1 Tax=Salmonirosea aquatica TaxID=2654236 RepID=A0A7C9FZZ5_9BACT|nr:hypothetical protein [Cytophagaceae bacterium SJW1-29]